MSSSSFLAPAGRAFVVDASSSRDRDDHRKKKCQNHPRPNLALEMKKRRRWCCSVLLFSSSFPPQKTTTWQTHTDTQTERERERFKISRPVVGFRCLCETRVKRNNNACVCFGFLIEERKTTVTREKKNVVKP